MALHWGGQISRPPFLLPAAWDSDEKAEAPAAIFGREVILRQKTHERTLSTKVGKSSFLCFRGALSLCHNRAASSQASTDSRINAGPG